MSTQDDQIRMLQAAQQRIANALDSIMEDTNQADFLAIELTVCSMKTYNSFVASIETMSAALTKWRKATNNAIAALP